VVNRVAFRPLFAPKNPQLRHREVTPAMPYACNNRAQEDAMLRIRIVSTGAFTALAVMLAVSGANAQTATDDQAGPPLALLAGLKPPHHTKAIVHAKASNKTEVKVAKKKLANRPKAIAAKESTETPEPASPLPGNSRPTAAQTAPENAAAAQPMPDSTPATDEPALAEMAVNGQTVQVVSPDVINDIDLASGNQNTAAGTPPLDDKADAAPMPAPAVAVAMHEDASPVGSASWIAQVLAALGGAIAAGSVAWLLIGSGPQRTYG